MSLKVEPVYRLLAHGPTLWQKNWHMLNVLLYIRYIPVHGLLARTGASFDPLPNHSQLAMGMVAPATSQLPSQFHFAFPSSNIELPLPIGPLNKEYNLGYVATVSFLTASASVPGILLFASQTPDLPAYYQLTRTVFTLPSCRFYLLGIPRWRQ